MGKKKRVPRGGRQNGKRDGMYRNTMLWKYGRAFFCLAVVYLLASRLDSFSQSHQMPESANLQASQKSIESLCRRYLRGDFAVFSHRSFVDAQALQQPSCESALQQLLKLGIHHLDLDLVYGSRTTVFGEAADEKQLWVAHPMEFKGTSNYYSPCALITLDEVIDLLDAGFGEHNWMVTLEPKAHWGHQEPPAEEAPEDPALGAPAEVLRALLRVLRGRDGRGGGGLRRAQCGVIVPPSEAPFDDDGGGGEVASLVRALGAQCQLVLPVRRDGLSGARAPVLGSYDFLMPTVELHPRHPNFLGAKAGVVVGESGLRRPAHDGEGDWEGRTAVYWVVDDLKSLVLAAEGFIGADSVPASGLVSNVPLVMASLLQGPELCGSRPPPFHAP